MAKDALTVLRESLLAGNAPEVWVRFPRQLGDVLFALPFFGSLQRAWNEEAAKAGVRLKWIAVGHTSGAALFSEAHPDLIAEFITETKDGGKPDPWHLLRRWRRQRPAAVINLSQSVRLALAAFMARVPIRAGDVNNHLGVLYHHGFTYRDLDIPIVERFRPLLKSLTGKDELYLEPVTPERFGGLGGPAKLRAAGWKGEPYVTLAFGTRGFPKRWFPEVVKWPELARIFLGQGLGVVWLGGADEQELGARLAELAPGSYDLTGQTSIPEACMLQHGAYGNVAVDTGLAHTAAATGRPTITLLGVSPDPLINPLGPLAVGIRGPVIDIAGPKAAYAFHGNSTHRVSPLRIANQLHAIAAEAKGHLVSVETPGEAARG